MRQGDDNALAVIDEAQEWIQFREFVQTKPHLSANFDVLLDQIHKDDEDYWQAVVGKLQETALRFIELDDDMVNGAISIHPIM